MSKKLKLFDAEAIRSAVQPLADQLPSMTGHISVPMSLAPVTGQDYVDIIRTLWKNAQETFLEIGRYLEQAQRSLPPDEFLNLCSHLPMGKSARSQLMAAYRMVESRMLPEGCEQAGYATVYLCATLTEGEREEAISIGVIRPSMTRTDIVAFRKRIRTQEGSHKEWKQNDSIAVRRLRIEREISQHEKRIAELRRELETIGEYLLIDTNERKD